MQKLFVVALLFISLQLTAQTKLSLIYKKETEVFDELSSEKISKTPSSLYYLNLTKQVSEYFLTTEKTIDGVTKNYPSQYLYKNLETNTFTQQLNDSGEYSHGKLQELKWSFKPETKKILGYTVKKAILESTSDKQIIAWYSHITYSNGPEIYYGLPGLILEIEETETVNGTIKKTLLTAVCLNMSKDSKTIANPLETEN